MTDNLPRTPIPPEDLAKLRQIAEHELRDIPDSTAEVRPSFEPGEMLWLLDQVEEARRLHEVLEICQKAMDYACENGDREWSVYSGFREARFAIEEATRCSE